MGPHENPSVSREVIPLDWIKAARPEYPGFQDNYSYLCYIALYIFVSRFCRDSRVLDAACGLGYGSSLLGREARFVMGIDLDGDTLDYAGGRYAENHVIFVRNDALKPCFAPNSFDVIASIETFEHIPPEESGTFLENLRDMLKPEGVCILSTPNRSVHYRISQNPGHVNEMEVRPFFRLLGEVFESVEAFYQRKDVLDTMRRFYRLIRTDRLKIRRIIPKGLRRRLRRSVAPEMHRDMGTLLEQLRVQKAESLDEVERAVFQIAVCRKGGRS
jgi:SAM-dependent methyltransferase